MTDEDVIAEDEESFDESPVVEEKKEVEPEKPKVEDK